MAVFRRNVKRKPFRAKGRKNTLVRKRRMTPLTMSSLSRRIAKVTATIETKLGVQTFPDGIEVAHNTFVTFSSALLSTFSGTTDEEAASGRRIGDKITIKSLQIKGMVELNERYSDVSMKVILGHLGRKSWG